MSVENYGDYQLIKRLASGGMASIFLARQRGLEGFEKLLVVKRILPHLAENEEFIKMFLDEARIAARLNHPNIVQIFNLGAQDDSFFIAMEYIHGEDVRRVWKRSDTSGKPIPLPLVCRIVMDACAGLDYAHKKTDQNGKPLGIVHRDISPQNILVTFEGGVKVVDFGIAKAADQATITKSGVLKGKYSYMSPEQAAGGHIDHRSDIFALGIVLYELLTGTRLFKRGNDIQTLNAVSECNVITPSTVNTRVPKSLDAVVMKALTKTADARYEDANAMQAALEEWLLQNKLPSSAVHLAAFMQDIYKDRLEREAAEGRVLVEELDKSRNPDELPAKATPTKSAPQQKATGSLKRAEPDLDVTRADRSGERREGMGSSSGNRLPPPVRSGRSLIPPLDPESVERERTTGKTQTAGSVTMPDPGAAPRFPWLWAAVLVVIGAGLGAWLVLRSTAGGVVRLVTDPAGAAVAVDSVPLADLATPCALPKLKAGTHTLTLTKKGFDPLQARFEVPDRGEVTLPPFKLSRVAPPVPVAPPEPAKPAVVPLNLKTSPPGASVTVDGKPVVGVTPLTLELTPGVAVALKLELAGYRDLETGVTVTEPGEQTFPLEKDKKKKDKEPAPPSPAKRELGQVQFKVDPWGVVTCDGLKLGETPFRAVQMAAGTHSCTFTNPELKKSLDKVVTVEPNQLTKVNVNLEQ